MSGQTRLQLFLKRKIVLNYLIFKLVLKWCCILTPTFFGVKMLLKSLWSIIFLNTEITIDSKIRFIQYFFQNIFLPKTAIKQCCIVPAIGKLNSIHSQNLTSNFQVETPIWVLWKILPLSKSFVWITKNFFLSQNLIRNFWFLFATSKLF